MPKLEQLVIRGVALVDQGANQHAKVLISKRAGGAMTDAEKKAADAKAAAEKQTKDLAEAQAALKAATDELATLKGSGGRSDDLDTLRKQYAESTKALTKERGELQEQITKAQKDAEDARAEVVKIKAQRRREQFIQRVGKLKHLPGAAVDDFAEILDTVEAGLQKVAPEKATVMFNKFDSLLSSWNAVCEKSEVFRNMGRDGTAVNFSGAEGVLHAMAKERATADKIPYQQAYAKVLKENPDIYARYRAEQET